MEGKTHYERVAGGTQEEKDLALKKLQDLFDTPAIDTGGYEILKTPEDIEFIKKIEGFVDSIVADYGGKPKPLPLDHIHILKPGSVYEITKRFQGGVHRPMFLEVGVEKGESKLLFASTLAHELFHLKSYKSARVGSFDKDVHLYRSGLTMLDRKDENEELGTEREYFSMLEEAIVAECTRDFIQKLGNEPFFEEDTLAISKLINWAVAFYRRSGVPEEKIKIIEDEIRYIKAPQSKVAEVVKSYDNEPSRQAYTAGMFTSLFENGDIEMIERYTEREKLFKLLDSLIEKSNGKFKNRKEIFDEFAKANFSGNYLPLARIVENILGKGMFRKIAEDFSYKPQ
jgi:hypothetical protein